MEYVGGSEGERKEDCPILTIFASKSRYSRKLKLWSTAQKRLYVTVCLTKTWVYDCETSI